LLAPIRGRKKHDGIPDELLAQLRAGGAAPAAAAAGGAGLAAAVARMAAPIVLRGVSSFVAGKVASRRARHEASNPNGVAP
jgi:hypothetical protein